MKSTLLTGLFVFVFGLLATGPVVSGQGVGTSADLTGTVTDPSGAAVPNAKITAMDIAKGGERSVMTDEHGFYRLSGLAPANYKVSVEHAGFQTELVSSLSLTVGQYLALDFHLKLSGVSGQVEVTSEPPVVETERGSESNTLNQQYIQDLPIDRRDYLTFTLLVPGVSDSTRLADDQDFRVKQTPQSGLSFYGSNGRGNSVTIDGGETSGDSGGVRLTLGQDAVQEFQVNRSNYGADLGAANGASINIVSKSGTDDVHATLFSYFRNDAMDARDPFAFSQALQTGQAFNPLGADVQGKPVKNSLQRYQFGGSLGGPIKKGKTQFFVAFEGLHQNSQNAVPLLTNTSIFRPTAGQQALLATVAGNSGSVPCLSGPVGAAVASQLPPPYTNMRNLPGPVCAGVLTSVLTLNPALPLNSFLINQFESQGGLFNYNTRSYLTSVRVDHRIDNSNQLTLTFRYGHDVEESPDVQSLTAFSAGSSIHTYDDTFQGAWFHQFSPRTQNELRAQWNYDSFNVLPNAPGEVGLQIPGFINNIGTNIFLPNLTILRRYEFADNISLIRGNHTFKFGGSELLRGNHTESFTFLPGRFVFGTLPGFLLTPQLPTLTSLESASFGLPQVYQQGFGNPAYPAYSRPLTGLYAQDSWKISSNFTLNYGVRYDIDGQFKPLNTSYSGVGPRISFAWDPFKDHKTVVRGGYGIFYGPVDAQIPQVDLSLGVLNKDHSTVENRNGVGGTPGQVNNAIATCGIAGIVPGTGASPCTRFISIYVDPINASGLPIQTAPVVFQTLFAQGAIQCTTPAAGNQECITPGAGPGGVAQFGIRVSNSGPLSPLTVLFSNPPNYKPPYSQQASLGIEREFAAGFSIGISGIYSHTLRLPVALDTNLLPAPISTVTLANGGKVSYRNWNGGTPGNPGPADPLGGTEFAGGLSPCANPFACFVNPLIVQNNQYTDAASALYEGLIFEVKKRYGNHFTVFGNYTFSKGFDTSTDFNTDYSPQDPTNLSSDRGLSEFDERHKLVIAGVIDSPWKGSILSGFQFAPIFNYHSGLPFNLLAGGEVNGDNHTTNQRPIGAPRDSGLGPNYYDFDARLSWQHKLGEKASVKFTAEGFNLANRTNYGSVNNEVNPLFGFQPGFTTFNVKGIKPGTLLPDGTIANPSTPLAFTSAFPKRQIQLGVRLTF